MKLWDEYILRDGWRTQIGSRYIPDRCKRFVWQHREHFANSDEALRELGIQLMRLRTRQRITPVTFKECMDIVKCAKRTMKDDVAKEPVAEARPGLERACVSDETRMLKNTPVNISSVEDDPPSPTVTTNAVGDIRRTARMKKRKKAVRE